MITKTINQIDERIAKQTIKYPCLMGAHFFGLAEPVVRRTNDDAIFPVIIGADCECTDVFVDDDFPIGIYHRLLSKQYSPTDKKMQYGDDYIQIAIVEMILICWALRDKINASADNLERLIYSCFPNDAKAVSSNFDRRNVFAGEFSGIPFNLPEDVMLFSMKYKFAYPATTRECIEIENFCK